jgi:hypothetical protein
MEIILKIFAGLTTLIGVFILLTAAIKRFHHIGMTLAGVSYLIGGLGCFYFNSWWTIILGISFAFFIRKRFGEPDFSQPFGMGSELPTRKELDDLKIGEIVITFLKSDKIGKNILSSEFQKMAEAGFLEKFSSDLNLEMPKTHNIVPWFMLYMKPKIKNLASYNSEEWNQILKGLSKLNGNYLEKIYQISTKYNINADLLKSNPENWLKMLNNDDRLEFSFAIFADVLLHTELRILEYLYSEWNLKI